MDGSQPLGGLKITIAGSKLTSTTTNANGNYSFSDLRSGGSYTITPRGEMNFTPPNRSFDNLRQDETADFTGNVRRDSESECQDDKVIVKRIVSAFLKVPQKESIRNLPPGPMPSPAKKTEAGWHQELEEGKSSPWPLTLNNDCPHPHLFRVKNKTKYLRFAQSTDSILVGAKSTKVLRGQFDATGFKSKKYRDKLVVECLDCQKGCTQDRKEFLVEMTVIKPRESVDTQRTDKTYSQNVLTPTPQVNPEQTSKTIGTIEEITFLEKCSLASVTIRYSSRQAAALNKNLVKCNKKDGKWRCDP